MKKSKLILIPLTTVIFSGCMSETIDSVNPMNYDYNSIFNSDPQPQEEIREELPLNNSSFDMNENPTSKEVTLNVLEQRVDTIESALIDRSSSNNDERFDEISAQLSRINLKLADMEKSGPISASSKGYSKNLEQDVKDLKQEVTFLKILNKRKNAKLEEFNSLDKKYKELEDRISKLEKSGVKVVKQEQKTINKPLTVEQKVEKYSTTMPSQGYFIVTAKQANVRAKASLNSRITKIAREDEIFKILSIKDSEGITWVETDRGFISTKTGEKIDSE
jgi:uncharacterized protein YdcH (DUF465 family)